MVVLSLERDRAIPSDRRPVFLFRVLTRRDAKRLRGAVNAFCAVDESDASVLAKLETKFDAVESALRDQLVGWRRQPIEEQELDRFDELVTEDEMVDLAGELLVTGALGFSGKVGSASPSPENGGEADCAAAAAGNA